MKRAVALLLLALASCSQTADERSDYYNRITTYHFDPDTFLCFAHLDRSTVLVPCSAQVLAKTHQDSQWP